MKPYIRNGKMGVLVSPNYGSGWSSAYNDNRISWDERVIEKWLELKGSDLDKYEQEDVMEVYLQNIGYDAYMGGYSNLVLEWVGLGEFFFVQEKDGHEKLIREKDMQRYSDEEPIFMETREW